jgi:hypothetical protein
MAEERKAARKRDEVDMRQGEKGKGTERYKREPEGETERQKRKISRPLLVATSPASLNIFYPVPLDEPQQTDETVTLAKGDSLTASLAETESLELLGQTAKAGGATGLESKVESRSKSRGKETVSDDTEGRKRKISRAEKKSADDVKL